MLQKYDTILWDWNGTILNDVDLCVDISNIALRNEGKQELERADYQNLFGFPITAYYERIGIDLKKTSMETLTNGFIDLYTSKVKTCSLQNHITEVLQHLNKANKQQYVLTAAHTEIASGLLQYFNIIHYFKAVAGLDNHRAESKVSRGITLLKEHQISAQNTLLIGDTLHDFEVAEALGVHCILIAHGHQSKERLINGVKGKAKVLDNLRQLNL